GPLLLADIGGGSLEIALGDGAEPDLALSVPLGAGRLTREHLPDDPPRSKHVKRLRRHVADHLAAHVTGQLTRPWTGHSSAPADEHRPARAVATSKTFNQLARLTGGTTEGGRSFVAREDLRTQIPRLAELTARKRARLRGVS